MRWIPSSEVQAIYSGIKDMQVAQRLPAVAAVQNKTTKLVT